MSWRAGLRKLLWVLLAAGMGIWGALLFAPEPALMPPALTAPVRQHADTTPLAQWFGGGARLRVTVAGLMRSDDQGAALLAVNGGAPRAYRQGEALAPGVVLAAVQADGVLIDQDGVTERLSAPKPAAATSGFRVVRPAAGLPPHRGANPR